MAPHKASFPEKLSVPNLLSKFSDTRPNNKLFERLSCLRCGIESSDRGIRPEISLLSSRRVNNRVRDENSVGIEPLMLLLDKSNRTSLRRDEISLGMSPERSLLER